MEDIPSGDAKRQSINKAKLPDGLTEDLAKQLKGKIDERKRKMIDTFKNVLRGINEEADLTIDLPSPDTLNDEAEKISSFFAQDVELSIHKITEIQLLKLLKV